MPGRTEPSPLYRVWRVDWAEDALRVKSVRYEVFVQEQQVPESLEWDGLDPRCKHILVADPDGVPVATGRLDTHGKIGRMAVLKAHRGKGAGSLVLEALLAWAGEIGLSECYLHAQTHAVTFYHRHGFLEEGFVFYEAGIPHLTMRRPAATPIVCPIDSLKTRFTAWQRLLWMTRRELVIDAAIPDWGEGPGEEVLAEIQRVALAHREPTLRILADPEIIRNRSLAPLLALARKLASHIHLKCPAPEDGSSRAHWILGDGCHGIHLPDPEALEGRLILSGPGLIQPVWQRFEARWERGLTHPDFSGWSL